MPWLLSLVLVGALADDARFADATTRFRKLDYEGALAGFDALLAEPHADDERTLLLLYSGAARALIGDEGGARLAFETALRVDEHAALTFKTSPKVADLFDDVKKKLVVAHPVEPVAPAVVPVVPKPAIVKPVAQKQDESIAASTWVGLGSLAVTAASVAVASTFAIDVVTKMNVANDKHTSQQSAQALVDQANGSLTWALALGGAGVAAAGVAVVAFAWP